MSHVEDMIKLKEYAEITNSKILESQADLDPKDRAMTSMLAWCREQKNIVVLQNNRILCSNPTSRIIQNCKNVMLKQELIPGKVYAANQALIQILLENAELNQNIINRIDFEISTQQKRLRMLVQEAVEMSATDIHIEVRSKVAKIRLRRHGELILHAEWLPKLANEIVSVAFNNETDHASSHFNSLIPQNASMPITIGKQDVRLRLASLPAHEGYDVVMRILAGNNKIASNLGELGYTKKQQALLEKASNMPSGAIIIAGPTGSGKTTTLASIMQNISEEKKVYSVEDPVEQVVTNITQVPVNTEHYDRTFANMARTALRMDPDILVIGEMRDEDTANIMLRAAITGHLVFSTLHTNSAIDIITRLKDLGISSSLLASPNFLVCLVCQRLAPRLCQKCAVPLHKSNAHYSQLSRWEKIFNDTTQLKARANNCVHCQNQGISGRTIIAEILWLDSKGRECILENNMLAWQKHLKKNGWESYQDQLIKMVSKGLCDPLDAENLAGEFQPFLKSSFCYDSIKHSAPKGAQA